MRMSELSERSGVSVPSVKFYLREGLLPAGERTSANQATYAASHVERLRLIRALIEVGGLSVSAVRAVLAAVDATDMPLTWAFGVAQRAVSRPPAPPAAAGGAGFEVLQGLLRDQGWEVDDANPGLPVAAGAVDAYVRLGHDNLLGALPAYARAASIIAEADLAAVAAAQDRPGMVQSVVVGTVLGDALLAGLRRLAQEDASRRLFPAPPAAPDSKDALC